MLLSQLLKGIKILSDYQDREVVDVTDKALRVSSNVVFVCIEGSSVDGHGFAMEAISKGASAIIVTRDLGLKEQIVVENTREAYALMCKNFWGAAADKLTLIGVTGTNGKTSTAFAVKDILNELGVKVGAIGTIKNLVGEKEFYTELTTPDPYDMHRLFGMMVNEGIEYCVVETSSQAFHQNRLAGVHFKTGVFTNLTQDHLDYHGSMQAYKECKKMLFDSCDNAVVNADDESAEYMVTGINAPVKTYSINKVSDYKAENVKLFGYGVEYDLNGSHVVFRVPGDFSVYNSLCAIASVCSLGFCFRDVVNAVAKVGRIKGRLELLETETDFNVVIDYAHTPDGLTKALKTVRGFTRGRIITLFGCGGDRDKTKRPKMGCVAAKLSDVAVVTTDNPRTEDPDSIIDDIMIGTIGARAQVVRVTDRSRAIEYALGIARRGDTVLLAGKGHETYQVIGEKRVHYDEREVVAEVLERLGK